MAAKSAIPGLDEFLLSHPFISIKPLDAGPFVLEGEFQLRAQYADLPLVSENYNLQISVPADFPKKIPDVVEVGAKIPRLSQFHVNLDGTLCLGSNLRLMLKIQSEPTLVGFSQNCLVPYLYAVTLNLKEGTPFVFGELPHGELGEMKDYREILGLDQDAQVLRALRCILLQKRLANKKPCPCGCRRRLGRCPFNAKVREWRQILPKEWLHGLRMKKL